MQVTRTQLYQEIWRDPISKVARKYGVSDTAMRKKCKASNIPIPTNKYWGQLRNGHNPKPDKLVPEEDKLIQFKHIDKAKVIIQKPLRSENDHLFQPFDQVKRNKLLEIYDSLSIKNELTKPHPLILKHQQVMRQIIRTCHTNFVSQQGPLYDVNKFPAVIDTFSTTENCFPRLYLFLDSLFNAVEAAGDKVYIQEPSESYFIIDGVEIPFRIKERYTTTYLPINERRDKWDSGYRFMPSGLLTVIFFHDSSYYRHNGDKFTFNETPRRKLSDMIKFIFAKLYEIPQINHEFQMECEERERKAEEDRKQRKEYEERVKAKKAIHDAEVNKMNEFIFNSQLFQLSQSLRNYISSIELTLDTVPDEKKAELTKWLQWAKEKADWLDPACNKDDAIFDLGDKHRILTELYQGRSSSSPYSFRAFSQ